jgi:uncharacterized protein YeaO (DUF488 family)
MGEAVCYLNLLDEEGRMPEPAVTLRRVYDQPAARRPGETRVLVDAVWPRGVRKAEVDADLWPRALAPSADLRRWFGHRPDRWDEFRRRYREELREPERSSLLDELAALARRGPVTLLYGARDRARNQAVVIVQALDDRLT